VTREKRGCKRRGTRKRDCHNTKSEALSSVSKKHAFSVPSANAKQTGEERNWSLAILIRHHDRT
jgi:hypothetical protein